jgi:hypothetical protein
MDAISFKEALAKAKPSVQDLITAGLSKTDASQFLLSYDVNDRLEKLPSEIPDPTLRDLFSRFDLSGVEIGMVRLLEHPNSTEFGWIFGLVESDPILVDQNNKEIVSIDHEAPEHVVWRCAKDGNSFLSALALSAKYLSGLVLEHDYDTNYKRDTLNECTSLAGGGRYSDFFRMLLNMNE